MFQTMDSQNAWKIFRQILYLITNPERRCNLHLRYLRDHSKIQTTCCDRNHCFRCKTKDYHDLITCEENMNRLDSSIITCPGCQIAITKGDGCNSIVCYCGKQFSWTIEKETTERANEFVKQFPINTAEACVQVLCRLIPGNISQANGWRTRNIIAMNKAFINYWKLKYNHCPTQCCAYLEYETLIEGDRLSVDIWTSLHPIEVAKCCQQNLIAIESIFHTIFQTNSDKINAIKRMKLNTNDIISLTAKSMKLWMESNQKTYETELENWENRSANQFLYLYGNKKISILNQSSYSQYIPVSEWDILKSNEHLTYSNQNTTVKRIGNVSCYPAAFCKLSSPMASITVTLDQAPRGPNWLTFGLSRIDMPVSGSDGVGRTSSSWGICDDRSTTSNNQAMLFNCGQIVSTFRKLIEGDILKAEVNMTDGWLEISLNDDFHYKFTIPITSNDYNSYCFAMTFANDHQISIVNDISIVGMNINIMSNDHKEMLNNLRRIIRKMMYDDNYNITNDMIIIANTFQKQFNNDINITMKYYENYYPIIHSFIYNYIKIYSNDNNSNYKPIIWSEMIDIITWKQLYQLVVWNCVNKQYLLNEIDIEKSNQFFEEYQESAPFMAAAILANTTNKTFDEMKISSAKAFMKVYSNDMNDWYNYNATLKEPLLGLENMCPKCVCLPRHINYCPKIGK